MTDYQHEKTLADHRAWLGTLAPEGLVVSPAVLADAQLVLGLLDPERQRVFTGLTARRGDFLEGRELTPEQADEFFIADVPRFLERFLGWPADLLLGTSPSQPVPEALRIPLPELHEELFPTYALSDPKPKDAARPWLLLIKVLPVGTDLDKETTGDSAAWTASPTRRFERLLRETGVPIGLVTAGTSLRLVYAPRGESAGTLTFPVGFMREVAGRRVLAALEMLLSRQCLLAAPTPARLPTLLAKSRDFQATVSTALAQQVIDAAFELVRGFQSANEKTNGTLLADVLATKPNEVYEGLLTVLMRLVFTLYAEDRGLLPSSSLYQQHYGIHGLFERLRGDAAKHPDTMDLRFGAWAQLVALFRLIYAGSTHPELKLPARSGYLFDPDRFPWLEGRTSASGPQRKIPAVPDGTLHRVLEKLLMLDGERLSYRTLDVEQIGSVYEVMMGFGIGLADGPSIAIKPKKKHGAPVPVNLDALLATKPADRSKTFEQATDHKLTAKQSEPLKAATSIDALLATLEAAKKIARSATPQPLAKGAIVLVPSDERRRSGSNYTPRKLTEPIVRKTLEPILAHLAEEKVAGPFSPGEKVPATLSGATFSGPTPQQLLDLKICDPAMGSGAFLVEACRQLADHLVVAWQRHGGMPPVPPDEDELLLAKRLVAQKCLYGVDKNPMAADLAKLSLWLATLAKDHPFTFLDHSLRAGDSLVGLGRKQIASLHWDAKAQRTTVTKALEDAIGRAAAARRDILEGGDFLSPELKAQKLALADDALSKPRLIGDCVIAAFFAGSKPKERQAILDRLTEPVEDFLSGAGDYVAARGRLTDLANWLHGRPRDNSLAASDKVLAPAEAISHPLTPFHWELEFPEVFGRDNPGFDAIVGNPPFVGVKILGETTHPNYTECLRVSAIDTGGKCDLVAFFFRAAYQATRNNGTVGFLATKTIGQGDTRRSGLGYLARNGASIFCATKRFRWPGEASVLVSVIHLAKGPFEGEILLDGRRVRRVSSYLFESDYDEDPSQLAASEGFGFLGSKLLGMGFIFDDADVDCMPTRLANEIRLREPHSARLIRPYIGGEDLNAAVPVDYSKEALDLNDLDEPSLRAHALVYESAEKYIKPQRANATGVYKERWWQYAHKAKQLYDATHHLPRLLVLAQYSPTYAFAFIRTGGVINSKIVGFATDHDAHFAIFQSRFHESWARFLSGTLGDSLQYTPSACLVTFPFPENFETDARLEAAGKEYYEFRAALMVKNDEGLTKTYNRFHGPGEASAEIARLRELHAAMDRAVLDAYGWPDVQPACGFALDWLDLDDEELADTLASAPDDIRERIESADYFFPDAASACRFQSHIKKDGKGKLPWRYRWPDDTRDDILARLLALNAQRAELERLTGLPAGSSGGSPSASPDASDYDPGVPPPLKAKRAKKGTKRASKKSASRPMFKDDTDE
jgi:hypothetical protein